MNSSQLTECLAPHVDALRAALAGSIQLGAWLGAPDLDALTNNGRRTAHFALIAYGYIQGLADAYDQTMIEMLDSFDFDLNL